MKISSFSSLNKNFQSYNSLSSMETIDSPVQIFEKNPSSSKRIPSRPLINSIISKEDLRQVIVQDSFSSKNSLRRLDSYGLSDSGSCAGVNIKSERNINLPVRVMQQSSHKKNQQSYAAPQEVYLDSSADEDNHPHMAPQYSLSQYASQQAINCIADNDYDSESDSDEYNIWDNSDAQQMGIDIDNSEIPFEFCQLFYIRSQLYQANKVNKNNVLEEVQVISNMCKKQMNMLRSNKMIDSIEKNYHLTLKKNAIQVSKLKIQKAQNARPISKMASSVSLKQTPKAFRISQYPLFHTPNKQTKQSSIPNIADDIVSPIYSSGRQLLAKSTTNFKMPSCDTLPVKCSSPNSPNLASSAIKKVNLKLNSPQQSQRPASKLGQERFISINKQSIYNSLGKTVSHSKFYPMQEIKI